MLLAVTVSFDQAMAVLKVFAEIVAALAWPLAVLAIDLLFRSRIESLLSRVRQIKATGVELLLNQLEQQGQLPVAGRAELQGLTAHDIWALDNFATSAIPTKTAAMNIQQRVAARTLLDAGLLVLKGSEAQREVEVTALGKKLLEAAKALL